MNAVKKTQLFTLLVALGCASPGRADDAANQGETFLRQHPDFIVATSGETNIHHRCFNCDRIHTNMVFRLEAADAAALSRGRETVVRALARYPVHLITSHVDHVYLARHLEKKTGDSWAKEAGVSGLRSLYLTQCPTYNDLFREAVFHHELCHLFLSAYKKQFSREAWTRCNPEGFSYLKDTPLSQDPKPNLQYLEEGFVCSYGRSAFTEDVCTYAMWLFARSDWVLEQAAQHPRVQAKLDLLLAFYASLDPFFTLEQFRSHGPPQETPASPKSVTIFPASPGDDVVETSIFRIVE